METRNPSKVSYRALAILTAFVGAISAAFQLLPGSEIVVLFCIAVLGGLVGGEKDYQLHERDALERSFRKSFERLFLIIFCAFALIITSQWLAPLEGLTAFLNANWSALTISTMCMLMGLTGLSALRAQRSA